MHLAWKFTGEELFQIPYGRNPTAMGWLSALCFSQLHHALLQTPDEKGVPVTNVDIVLVLVSTPGVESRSGLS